MVLFEPVHGGAALRWCGRFRAGTCATATVFTITNLVPGGGPINLLTEQLAGMPLLSAAGLVTFLASGVLLSLYFGSLVLSQKLAQHRLRRLRSDTGAIPRTFLYLRSCVDGPRPARDYDRRGAVVACSHVSGLLMQSGRTAGPDGFRQSSAHHSNGIEVPMKRQASLDCVGTTDCHHHVSLLSQARAVAPYAAAAKDR